MNTGPLGSELTKEPFRWDQRLFAIVLALPANASSAAQAGAAGLAAAAGMGDLPTNQFIPAAIDQPITAMCDVTGGPYDKSRAHRKHGSSSRPILSDLFATSAPSMSRVTGAENSNRCRCQSGQSDQRRYGGTHIIVVHLELYFVQVTPNDAHGIRVAR